jgi:hypothetical protein
MPDGGASGGGSDAGLGASLGADLGAGLGASLGFTTCPMPCMPFGGAKVTLLANVEYRALFSADQVSRL